MYNVLKNLFKSLSIYTFSVNIYSKNKFVNKEQSKMLKS